MPSDFRLRLIGARAVALGGVATIFGTIGHVEAGGSDPGPAPLALIWLGASLLSAVFLMRRVGLVRIATLLLVEQVLVHVSLMSFIGMPMPPSSIQRMAGMPGMENMPGMTTAAPMSVFPSIAMLAAHAFAAVIAGLWLWRGECAVWSLATRIRQTLRIWWIAPVACFSAPDLRVERETRSVWEIRIAREAPRRGPPRFVVL